MATDGGSAEMENAYEKLSREVHQMQITGAIHTDWLENPKGFLLKPDFKRKMQLVGAGGKKLQSGSTRGLRLHLPGSTYRQRWFVLDGMILRYFKTNSEDQELGAIHLASVNAVLPSSVADAPDHALDLVCADRIYTVAATNREDMVRWATVLTLVLRGEYKPKLMQRPESTIIRGSSAIPRPSALARKTAQLQGSRHTDLTGTRMTAVQEETSESKRARDEELQERIITVTFDLPGPLFMMLRGTVEDEVMVCGFEEGPDGSPGPAEASGAIRVGDILIAINQHFFTNIEFNRALELIKNADWPLTLRFSRLDTSVSNETCRTAAGWVLAKEPASHRYRIRMLQLVGEKLMLFKPSIHSGKASQPCLVMKMDDVTDLRPINDTREVVSACTQCHPKQWGLILEGPHSFLKFYTKNRQDLIQWIDVIKNCPLFGPNPSRVSIPVHPIAVVEINPLLESSIIIEDSLFKCGDLLPSFSKYYFVLLEDGKIVYYLDAASASNRARSVGTIRCDSIVSIIPGETSENQRYEPDTITGNPDSTNPNSSSSSSSPPSGTTTSSAMMVSLWRLEIGVNVVTSSQQRYRRIIVLGFENQEKMLKWATFLGKEAKRLSGVEFDLSLARRYSRTRTSSRISEVSHRSSDVFRNRFYLSRFQFRPQVLYPPVFRSLKDVTSRAVHRGWFFVKRPGSLGLEAYHPRFVVLREHELFLFKYEISTRSDEMMSSFASCIDLRQIKEVQEVESGFQDNLDFTIQLTSADDSIWTLVAEKFAQKEMWLSTLIWITDYYHRPGELAPSSHGKVVSHGASLPLGQSPQTMPRPAPTSVGESSGNHQESDFYVSENCTEIRGYLQISNRRVYAAIVNGVFSYYDQRAHLEDEWGDAIDSISIQQICEVHSDVNYEASFVFQIRNESSSQVHLVAETPSMAKKWMLVMCSCAGLILHRVDMSSQKDCWKSSPPKEAMIWKLDRLYQVFRQRFFSLRNHQLVCMSQPNGGRILGIVSLPSVFRLVMSHVCTRTKEEEFYQLDMSFALPNSEKESNEDHGAGDFYALSLAFDSEHDLRDWAQSIYECCTNSMSLRARGSLALPPLSEIQTLPKELLKKCTFESSETPGFKPDQHDPIANFSSRGWLFYRTSSEERIRLRYFVQWGYELSIYKHEILPDEQGAIRYGVIDCRALVDVRFAYVNSPENAVELLLRTNVSVIIIPRTDEEAVMWRNGLMDLKRAYGGQLDVSDPGDMASSPVLISRGSTFATQKDTEDLLRLQIEACVVNSANLQDWDGKKWIPKYFVLTLSRVLILSLAVHLYDEEPDMLGSFATKDITDVRSCNEEEDAQKGNAPGTAFMVCLRELRRMSSELRRQERYIIKCDTADHCLEWMRLLCNSNGKLELKKNAATGLWGSVNRIASMSQHQSFYLAKTSISSTPTGSDTTTSRRSTRQDAARRRTSELLMHRKLTSR